MCLYRCTWYEYSVLLYLCSCVYRNVFIFVDVQPSPYCVYQFYDNRDHDTTIIRNSNNPEFNDHKTYPVPMTADFDQFLKTTVRILFWLNDLFLEVG